MKIIENQRIFIANHSMDLKKKFENFFFMNVTLKRN